jgi:uncharacterized RDD family membrane protein YckC
VADQRGIITPEAVVLEFETAGIGSRAMALALDLVAIAVVLVGVMFVIGLLALAGLQTLVVILQILLAALVWFGYPVACEVLNGGRTPGKAALGLRVVTAEGAPVRFRHAATRVVLLQAELFLPVLALLSMALTRQNQRLGDLFAGTIVLRERSGAAPAVAVRFPAPSGWEGFVATLDTSGLTPDQYGTVRRYLMRVGDLEPSARAALAVRLAQPVALRLHHTPPAELSPELYLVCVASAYQLRHGAPPLPWERVPGFSPEVAADAPPVGASPGVPTGPA